MRSRSFALVLALAALLALVGALALSVGAQGGGEPFAYRIAILDEQTTENIWALNDTERSNSNTYIQQWLYPHLYRSRDGIHAPLPYLAADFPSELVQQGEFWVSTVPLKEGVQWSDGAPVTADDLIFTAQVVNDLGLAGNWSWFGATIHHIEAAGPYTATFYFSETLDTVDRSLWANSMPIVAEHYWAPIVAMAQAQPDPVGWLYDYDPVGEPTAGPYKRSEWLPGDYVEHVVDPLWYFAGVEITAYANGAYHESLPGVYEFTAYGEPAGPISLQFTYGPYATNVRYVLYASEEDAAQALVDGDVDFVLTALSSDVHDPLIGVPGVQAISNPSSGFRYMAFNIRRSPMDVLEFRQAVGTLIDRDYLAGNLQQPVVWDFVLEDNVFWYTPTVRIGEGLTRQERISDTVDLLSGAGFTWTVEPAWDPVGQQVIPGSGLHHNGTPVAPIELLAPDFDYDPLRATAALSISLWLNEAGISNTAVLTDWNTLIGRIFNSLDFDTYILGWGLGRPDYPSYLCDFFYTQYPNNTPGYANPVFDALCEEFRTEMDVLAARQDVYAMQAILANDLPYVNLFSPPILEAYRSDSITFPYTGTLGGLLGRNGLPAAVQFLPVEGTIETGGGTLEVPGGSLQFPAGAFTDTILITYTAVPPSGSMPSAGIFFDITAVYSSTGEPAQLAPGATFTIVVSYDENALPPSVPEHTLQLYYWDDAVSDWVAEPTSVVDPVANTLTATPDHLSLWGEFGDYRYDVYLPITLKSFP